MHRHQTIIIHAHFMTQQFLQENLEVSFLRNISLTHTHTLTDYSEERLVATTNSDLPNTLGNLLHRISSPRINPGGPTLQFHTHLFPTFESPHSHRNPEHRATSEDHTLIDSLQDLPGKTSNSLTLSLDHYVFLSTVQTL